MFEADTAKTSWQALLDEAGASRAAFATRTIEWARDNGHDRVVWHFAAKEVVERVASAGVLAQIAAGLVRHGEHEIGGVTVELATPRIRGAGAHDAPLAVWWASDARLLEVDSGHRPLIDAFVSHPWSAPVWLTAFGVDLGVPVGVRDDAGLISPQPRVARIVVPDAL